MEPYPLYHYVWRLSLSALCSRLGQVVLVSRCTCARASVGQMFGDETAAGGGVACRLGPSSALPGDAKLFSEVIVLLSTPIHSLWVTVSLMFVLFAV